jgi:hypothetical protein
VSDASVGRLDIVQHDAVTFERPNAFSGRGIERQPLRKLPQGQGRDVVSDCKDRLEIIALRPHAMSQNVGKTTFGARCGSPRVRFAQRNMWARSRP